MKINFEKTETTPQELDIPLYGIMFNDWYYKVISPNEILRVTPDTIAIGSPTLLFKHVIQHIEPCEPEFFYTALAGMLNKAERISGINILDLQATEAEELEGGAYVD